MHLALKKSAIIISLLLSLAGNSENCFAHTRHDCCHEKNKEHTCQCKYYKKELLVYKYHNFLKVKNALDLFPGIPLSSNNLEQFLATQFCKFSDQIIGASKKFENFI